MRSKRHSRLKSHKSVLNQPRSVRAQYEQEVLQHSSWKELTMTKLDSWVGGALVLCFSTFTCLHRPSSMVCSYNTGTMRSSCPPERANTLAYQVWSYYRAYLGTCGCPGLWSVSFQRINTPFAPNSCILASSSRRNSYKSHSSCSGGATKTCGIYGWRLILHNFARRGFERA